MHRLGVALLVVFYLVERGTASPLIQFDIFRARAFRVENFVLGIAMLVGIPVYFFASEYAQVALGKPPIDASLVLLYFFIGFVVAAQIGGRMLDRAGAKRPVVLGCVLAAVGFALWAGKATDLSLSSQIWFIILAGAGMGLMQGQANTDAVNRASGSVTAKPQASPRRSVTTRRASALLCSAPSWVGPAIPPHFVVGGQG